MISFFFPQASQQSMNFTVYRIWSIYLLYFFKETRSKKTRCYKDIQLKIVKENSFLLFGGAWIL